MRLLSWCLVSCAALSALGCSRDPNPVAFVRRYTALHRSGQVERLVALHTVDTEFVIPGQDAIRGTAALRDLFAWDAILGSDLVMDAISAEGDTIRVDLVIERNRWFQALGIAEVRHKPGTRLVLRDGLIRGTYPAAFEDATQRRVADRFGQLVEWLSANRPDVLERLLPGGKFRYDAASAKLWLEVLQGWQNARR